MLKRIVAAFENIVTQLNRIAAVLESYINDKTS